MSDPVIRRVRRSIDEAKNRGGMQAGEALEAAQRQLANDMFDAYVECVPHVVEQVDDWLASCDVLPRLLREGLAKDCAMPVGARCHASYYAVYDIVSAACKEISERCDTLEKVEDFWL